WIVIISLASTVSRPILWTLHLFAVSGLPPALWSAIIDFHFFREITAARAPRSASFISFARSQTPIRGPQSKASSSSVRWRGRSPRCTSSGSPSGPKSQEGLDGDGTIRLMLSPRAISFAVLAAGVAAGTAADRPHAHAPIEIGGYRVLAAALHTAHSAS